ncbi:MAG: FkbM family methyltransferase [Phycisphaerales bacterium]
MFSCWDAFGQKTRPVKIIDIGAMLIGKPDYAPLLKPNACELIGFEADENECQKLNECYKGQGYTFLPYFIGDGSKRTFNIGTFGATSSLYEPNMKLLENFQNLPHLHKVVKRIDVLTKRLDDIPQVQAADYIKIDVQGAECDVFKGAENLLKEVMVIHTEVEFIPLYINQPLFGDVDVFLRQKGFLLHEFHRHAMAGRAIKPFIVNNDPNRPLSQVMWADVIYVKNLMELDKYSPEKLLKMAIILHDIYGSYDLVHYILQHYDKQTNEQFAQKYMVLFSQPQAPGKSTIQPETMK